jgi:hypothetical protein
LTTFVKGPNILFSTLLPNMTICGLEFKSQQGQETLSLPQRPDQCVRGLHWEIMQLEHDSSLNVFDDGTALLFF